MRQYISERICQLRKAKGLTQEKLGAMLGVTSQAVSKWEKGESFPDILILQDLCEILGTTSDALLGGNVTANADPVASFCEFACRNGINQTLMTAMQQLHRDQNWDVCSYLDMGSRHIRLYDPEGFCFVAEGDRLLKWWLSEDMSDIAPLFYLLRSEEWMRVLGCFSTHRAMTISALAEETGLNEDFVIRAVNEFVSQGFITAGRDLHGDRGYLQSEGMAGVYMMLAGAMMLRKEPGMIRLSHQEE